MSGNDILEWAKLHLDLPGFLGLHGYRPAPEKDAILDRRLDGPGGKLLVSRREGSKEWLWMDIHDKRRGGSILDACMVLLGMTRGQAYGELRRLRTAPPSPIPLAGRSTAAAPADYVRQPERTLLPLSEFGAEYLMGRRRCLDLSTVQAFAHRLRADPADGHLIAPHNEQGDGERHIPLADGSTKKRFHGNRLDGPGRGRSIWDASPQHKEPAAYLIVGDTFVDAISLWQRALDPDVQPRAVLVSTGGSFSELGKLKLERVAKQANRECRRAYQTPLVIVDASDVGEKTTPEQETTLRALAAAINAEYERWASPVGKDWSDAVQADRHAQEAQEASQAEEVQSAYILPAAKPEEAQEERPRVRGRGR